MFLFIDILFSPLPYSLALAPSLTSHGPPMVQATPMMMNGMERSCPMSIGSPASKATCTSFVYSMKKRKVKISARSRPKKNPVPTQLWCFFQKCHITKKKMA